VLVNVESYYRAGVDADPSLDFFRSIARYPDTYPATRNQACNMWLLFTQQDYVRRFVTPPSGLCD
jgi:hypothetical protein